MSWEVFISNNEQNPVRQLVDQIVEEREPKEILANLAPSSSSSKPKRSKSRNPISTPATSTSRSGLVSDKGKRKIKFSLAVDSLAATRVPKK